MNGGDEEVGLNVGGLYVGNCMGVFMELVIGGC